MLKETLLAAKIIDKGDYKYIFYPISDGIPRLSPQLLKEVIEGLYKIIEWKNVSVIITPEAMGIPVATGLSLKTNLPLTIVRKREYGLDGEIQIIQKTGYGGSKFFLNGILPEDKVVIVDCVVSTGDTLIGILNAVKSVGSEIADVVCVYSKQGGKQKVFEKTGVTVKTLIDVRVSSEDRVVEV